MKMNTHSVAKKFLPLMLAAVSVATMTSARGADVTGYDSIISLVTNVTKNYVFVDSGSGQSVTIGVTITPYSPFNASPTFQLLDVNTRVGIDFGNGFIDGRGANFSAALISASGGVTAGSVRFRIAGLGIRPADGGGS